MRRRSSSRGRCGFTLIEMMVAVITMSLIAATVSMLLLSFTRSNEGLQHSVQLRRTWARLGEQLRSDVRAATAVKHEDTLKLTTSAANIEYRRDAEGLERVATNGAGQVVKRELYRLPRHIDSQWELSPDVPTTITLRLTEGVDETGSTPRWFTTTAATVGSDRRFDPQTEGAK